MHTRDAVVERVPVRRRGCLRHLPRPRVHPVQGGAGPGDRRHCERHGGLVGFRFHPDQWRTTGEPESSALLFDLIGAATRADGATSTLTGHSFSASSTADADENFLVDDVYTRNG